MSKFQDMVEADRDSIFLNLDEYGSEHTVDGETINISLQDENTEDLQEEKAIGRADLTIYAKTEDLPTRRMPGDNLNVDSVDYIVDEWNEEMGITVIRLSIAAAY